MKNALQKSALREIRSTLSRFLSIFGIVALGVGFFSGVKAAAPDMRDTADSYLDRSELMDMRLVSTFGFDEDDIAVYPPVVGCASPSDDIPLVGGTKAYASELAAGVEVYPSYFVDLISHNEARSPAAARLFALTDDVLDGKINAIALTEGRMPENDRECVVDASAMKGGPAVGTTVYFTDNSGDEPEDMLSVSEYTIVGKVSAAMYIDKTTRGSTSVGNGSIEAAYYVPAGNFVVEYNTEVYVRFPELEKYNCYEDDYKNAIDELSSRMEHIGDIRSEERYDSIMEDAEKELSDAGDELADAEKEYDEKIAEAEQEIADAEAEIAENEQRLIDGAAEIAENEQKLADAQTEIAENEQKLLDGEAEIADNEKKLADAQAEIAEDEQKLLDAEKEIADNEKKLSDAQKALESGERELAAGEEEIKANEALLAQSEEQYNAGLARYESGAAALEAGKAQLAEQRAQLEAGKSALAAAMGVPAVTEEALRQAAAVNETAAQLLAGEQALAAAEAEFAQNEAVLNAAEEQLSAAKNELDAGKAQLEAAKAELEAARQELSAGRAEVEAGLEQLNEAKAEVADGRKQLEDGKAEIADGIKQLNEAKAELADGWKQLNDAKAEVADGQKQLDDAKAELADGQKQLEDAKAEVADGIKELADAREELEDGKTKLADGKRELEDGKRELEDKKAEGAEKIADAREKLDDARAELDDLDKPKWYVFTRDDTPGYSEYGENAERINNIAAVFPVFFIIVAMLVCLTTMSRMVEEQRVTIGTLKALGYRNRSIIAKYMFYAVSATLLGCVFGCAVGMQLFPFVIITAYGMMYDIPGMILSIDFPTALISSAVFTAAIALTVYLTARSSLGEQAAQLMRPKAPKNGKRILLERVTPVWKHFGFSGKVTARNLFRYKRKMLMTVIGISGCTALLLTGLALYDAINDIISKQFYDIQDYQGIFAYDAEKFPDAPFEAADIVSSRGGESIRVYQKLVTVKANGKSVDAYIAVPSEPELFTEFFDLRSRTSGEHFSLTDDTVYIDEKSSLLLGIGAGDTVGVENGDTDKVSVTVTAPFENYPNHYIYMTQTKYEQLFGRTPEYNVLYFRHGLGTGEAQDELGKEILKVDGALNVTFNSDTMVTFTKMLDTLSMVIVVIIASAGLLAFVVLYNLTNINITERIREIATLKVLGFYDGEVDSYIFRENIFLTLIGTAAGLVLGIFLARFVITTAEVDLVMFGRSIYPSSFVIAAIATIAFSVLVTLAMHRRLQNVNMIEALKSVE